MLPTLLVAHLRGPGRDARHDRDLQGDPQPGLRGQGAVAATPAPAAGVSPTSARASPSGRGRRCSARASAPASRPTISRWAASRSSTTSGSAACWRSARSACSRCWWMFIRAIRRLARHRARRTAPDAWLATTLAASLLAFAVGMFTFDAFAFIQVTFFVFIMLGFSAVITREDGPLVPRRKVRAAARAAARGDC